MTSWPSLNVDLDDLAVDPALDRDHVVGLHRADAVQEHRDILGGDGSGGDRDPRRRRLGRRLRHIGSDCATRSTAAATSATTTAAPITRLTIPSASSVGFHQRYEVYHRHSIRVILSIPSPPVFAAKSR